MLQITHTLTSGLIVTKIQSPGLSFPLILLFHYLLDFIPHWDTGTGLSKGRKTKKRAIIETIIDLAIAGFLVFFLFQRKPPLSLKLWAGIGLGIFPDILEAPVLFLNSKFPPLVQLKKIQDSFHHRLDLPWGLLIQLPIILCLSACIILFG